MKAYVTCPVSHTQDRLKLLPRIRQVVESSGMDVFVFEVGGDPEEIFARDYHQLSVSDVLIAEVSERSHGVGVEIGLSYSLGLKRILLHDKGQFVTKLARGMPDTVIIEYATVEELESQLRNTLELILAD